MFLVPSQVFFFLPSRSTCNEYLAPSLRANSHLRRQCSRKAVKPQSVDTEWARASARGMNIHRNKKDLSSQINVNKIILDVHTLSLNLIH